MKRLASILVGLLLLGTATYADAALVQSKRAIVNGPTSNPNVVQATFDQTPSVGNQIFVVLRGRVDGATASATTFSDNKGNSYATDVELSDTVTTGHIVSIGHAAVTTATATFTISASVTNTTVTDQYLTLWIYEYSALGTVTFDKSVTHVSTASTTQDSGATASTATANQFVLAVAGTTYNAGANTLTFQQTNTVPSSGWTDLSSAADQDNSGAGNGAQAMIILSSIAAPRHVWLSANSTSGYQAIATYQITPAARRGPLTGVYP